MPLKVPKGNIWNIMLRLLNMKSQNVVEAHSCMQYSFTIVSLPAYVSTFSTFLLCRCRIDFSFYDWYLCKSENSHCKLIIFCYRYWCQNTFSYVIRLMKLFSFCLIRDLVVLVLYNALTWIENFSSDLRSNVIQKSFHFLQPNYWMKKLYFWGFGLHLNRQYFLFFIPIGFVKTLAEK